MTSHLDMQGLAAIVSMGAVSLIMALFVAWSFLQYGILKGRVQVHRRRVDKACEELDQIREEVFPRLRRYEEARWGAWKEGYESWYDKSVWQAQRLGDFMEGEP